MASATCRWQGPLGCIQFYPKKKSQSLAGNHIHRCTHPHTCTFSSACLRQATREPQWVPKKKKKRIKDVTQPHMHAHSQNIQNRESFLPSLKPRSGNSHTCKRQTYTTVPPACDLHLGKGIFHLSVTATGQACIPTHTDTRTHTLYLLSLSLSPPATPFHSVDIKGPPPQTHIPKQKQSRDFACQPTNAHV